MESDSSFSYGVDWSESAEPTSHCWLPYCSKKSQSVPLCFHSSCTISPPIGVNTLVRCGVCSISVHKDHITDALNPDDAYNSIPPCRPSFSHGSIANDDSEYDCHHWSPIPVLRKPCMRCKRKKMPRTLTGSNGRTSTIPSENSRSNINSRVIHMLERSDSKLLLPSSGLVCQWCSQGCHRGCWQSINENDEKNKCNYGKYKSIIVRPQWLHRVDNSPARFYAHFTDDVNQASLTPLIIFINKLSGGQEGLGIYRRLIRLLNPRQVFLLENNATVEQAMNIYSSLPNIRVCVCGGDGTVGWILSTFGDMFSSLNNPPISICPLGTGNDLSRVLGWGWFYSMKRLLTILLQSSNAQIIALDRWQITFESLSGTGPNEELRNVRRCLPSLLDHPRFVNRTDRPSFENFPTPLNNRFTNYVSFGLDAAVVLDFHEKRLRNPSRFTSPLKNKIHYLNIGRKYFREFALWRAWNLGTYMRLIADGKDLTDSLRHCHTVVLLNITSYGSGTHPWSRTAPDIDQTSSNNQQGHNQTTTSSACEDDGYPTTDAALATSNRIGRQDIADRKIEVLGLDSIEMAFIHVGCRGQRIAQCSEVRIELIRPMPVHVDGDPFYLPASMAVNVTHAGQVLVLRNQDN